MPNKSQLKNLENKRYYCELCNTNKKDKYEFDIHLKTNKHKKNVYISENKVEVILSPNYKLLQENILKKQLEKIQCVCGSIYCKNDKSRHEKTKKHQQHINLISN